MSQQLPPNPDPGQPGPEYGAPPVKKKRTGLIVLLSIIGAFVVLCGGCGILAAVGGSNASKELDKAIATANPTTGGSAKGDKETVGRIGKPVRDGNFEFTVKNVKCGAARVGSQYLGKKAQGQFCVVTLAVKNIKNDPQMLSDSDQKAFVGTASYEADSEAGVYTNGNENSVFLNNVNPGNSVTGKVVFDIPKGKKLTAIELHDSGFSGGVRVDL
ncbi:MAG TPA: DUF4352 domain-containing protein [Mycobacteriales bacterium]|jgi:hypothetical protein